MGVLIVLIPSQSPKARSSSGQELEKVKVPAQQRDGICPSSVLFYSYPSVIGCGVFSGGPVADSCLVGETWFVHQGIRSHMLQLRSKILSATTKTQCSQINA